MSHKAGSIAEIIWRALQSNARVTLTFRTGCDAYLDECLVDVRIK